VNSMAHGRIIAQASSSFQPSHGVSYEYNAIIFTA
jgi:hypothetical protein